MKIIKNIAIDNRAEFLFALYVEASQGGQLGLAIPLFVLH